MTYQTTPFKDWVFPDEAYHMNFKGKEPLRPSLLSNPSEFLPGGGSEFQTSFYEHERQMALDRVANTIRAKQGMLGKLNTTARSQRYDRPASRSAVPNGVFSGSPMTYVTSAGLRGGVITTKEGRTWLESRLKQRAGEYEELNSGAKRIDPPDIPVSPYTEVNTILSNLFTSFDTGFFSSSVVESLGQLAQGLIRIGAAIEPRQLVTYAQGVQKMIESVRPYSGKELGETQGPVFEAREKRLRNVDDINAKLKIVDAIIREIARTINEPLGSRQQVMSMLGQRLLGEQIQQFEAKFAGPERMAAVQAVGTESTGRFAPPQMGQPAVSQSLLSSDVPYDPEQATGPSPSVWDEMPPPEPFSGSGRRLRRMVRF
jgi:hypothetical protein